MDHKEALRRAEAAADDVEELATRLQIKTEDVALDRVASSAKDLVHGVREALDDIEDDAEATPADDQAAKLASAAAAVEAELKEVAEDLEDALGAASAPPTTTTPPKQGESVIEVRQSMKSTEQAVKELELLAKKKAKRSIQASSIALSMWGLWALCCVWFIYHFRLFGRELFVSGVVGMLWGMLGTVGYTVNRRWKAERSQRLAMIPGAKGIQSLVHHLPSWISFSETEKMEWLNKILAKAWPYYDAAICQEVKNQVEPLMEQYRPPFIKRIYFKKLTFGDAPFRVEGIRVDETKTDQVQIDVDFRWAGDANIFLAIELPAGGSATRMVPKVSDMAVSGTIRVIFSPLMPEIPGFGAATVSLMKPPIVKFHLDFGAAFGGSYTAGAIVAWLDPFLRSTVAGMLVWPKRIVVPILPEEVTGPLDDLQLRHKGALQVEVLSASGLPKMDTLGSSDPYIEMYTVSTVVEKTSVKKNTLSPVWNERLWMLVQEPETQFAYITMHDVDFVNVKELFRLNVLKGATSVLNSKSLMGRAKLRIADFADQPAEPVETTLPLGLGEFNDEDGCGGGRGELKLRVTFWPLDRMGGHAQASFGALIVTLIKCEDLAAADLPIFSSDPMVKFTCNKETQTSDIVFSSLNPKWINNKFDWFRVPAGEKLEVAVWDYDRFSRNELLGTVTVDLHGEVASAPRGDVTKTWALNDIPTEWLKWRMDKDTAPRPSTITLRLQWIPFT